MSKEIKDTDRYLSYEDGWSQFRNGSGSVDDVETGNVPIVHRFYYLKHYLGVLLTSIEVLGLPERQEKSFKDVVKKNFWDFVQDGFIVPKDVDESLSPRMEEIIGDTPILTEEEAIKRGIDVKNITEEDIKLLNV
ncbi:MAG: hypothetical protein WC069_05870 [Candidatus Shapirobacteria bacterium]